MDLRGARPPYFGAPVIQLPARPDQRRTSAVVTRVTKLTLAPVTGLTDNRRPARDPLNPRRNDQAGRLDRDRPDADVAALRSGQAKTQGLSSEAVPSLRASLDGSSEVPAFTLVAVELRWIGRQTPRSPRSGAPDARRASGSRASGSRGNVRGTGRALDRAQVVWCASEARSRRIGEAHHGGRRRSGGHNAGACE